MNRTWLLKSELNLARQGLEIGALNNPCVGKTESDVLYVDHLPTEALKAKYREQGFAQWNDIRDVDVVVGPQGLRSAVGDRRFAYVIASHVVEHIHNPIAWLRDIHALLEPGGVLALAIPDQRYCFDALRAATTTPQWVDAYIRSEASPTPGQIFDALHNEVTLGGDPIWNRRDVAAGDLQHRTHPRAAFEAARDTYAAREYRDVHCSVFTPPSFFGIVRQLVVLELFDFHIRQFVDSTGHEFFVHLEKPAQPDWPRQMSSVPLMREGRFAALPVDFDPAYYLAAHPDIAAARLDPAEHYLNYGRREGRSWRAA